MKKILGLTILATLFLSGCVLVDEVKSLGNDVSNSYQKAAKETQKTIDEINKARAKVEETVQDLETAKNKIKEASDAVSEIAN